MKFKIQHSLIRIYAVIVKEVKQLLRDKPTFLSILLIPIAQVFLFGFVVNTDPRQLATSIVDYDQSSFSRSFIQGLTNTEYFKITNLDQNLDEVEEDFIQDKINIAVVIPANFGKDIIREKSPQVLLQANTINPLTTANAIAAAKQLPAKILQYDIEDIDTKRITQDNTPTFQLNVEPKYNPSFIPEYFSIPGLSGVILTLAMILMVLISIAREKEDGTLEYLKTSRVSALEVLLGKITPYLVISYFLIIFTFATSYYIFKVPILGSAKLLILASLPFILSNLFAGLFMSALAANQRQAVQFANLYLLPNLLFSGFVFPFHGMPIWAQYIGNTLPLTHYLRIIKGIMFKGEAFNIQQNMWCISIFTIIVIIGSLMLYNRSLAPPEHS